MKRIPAFLRPDNISRKILIASVTIVIIPIIIISLISGFFLSNRAERMYLERMGAELLQVNSVIAELISNAKMNLETMCDIPPFKNIKPGSLINYTNTTTVTDMNRVKRGRQEQDIYNNIKLIAKHHHDYVELYAGSRYGGFISSGDYKLKAGYDPRIRPWYKDAEAASGKVVVAKSYLSVTGDYVTAVVKSYPDDSGGVLFAAGIDISLKRLTEIINRIKIGETGYLVLIEGDGTILAHPVRPDLNSKKITTIGIPEFENILKQDNYVTTYSFEGRRKVAKILSSPETGWKFLAVIESSEINSSTFFYRIIMLVTTLLIILFCVFLFLYIQKGILTPIKTITDFGGRIAAGNYEQAIIIERNDELGRLADDFNSLMYSLKESVASIKAIIEFMPSMIIQLDHDGNIMEWNRYAEKFAGISIENARGKQLSQVKAELAVYLWNMKDVIKNEMPFSLYKIRITGQDDKYFNLFIFLLKLEHSSSLVLRIDDITDLEKKDEQLRQSQKMESIGFLASGVAHDFNNILGGILGAVSLVRFKISKSGADKTGKLDRDLELAERSCEDGADIASQLLNISRKDTDVEFHPSDLNNVLNQISRICMKSFDRSIIFAVRQYPENAPVMMSNSQIQQALLNICINASHSMTIMRKSGEHQGGYIDISLTRIIADKFFTEAHPEAVEGAYWNLSVRDTGVGMDSTTISKIYDPFFTTKNQTSVRGTGLGLSIVYSVIKNHHGFIDVYSEVGIGTVFSIYLPVYMESDSLPAEKKVSLPVAGEGTILVVDDDGIIREYTCAMLAECGYTFISAGDGLEGITLFNQNIDRISCVILDMVMPMKSGYETLVELMKIKPELPVLMTSGLKSKEILKDLKNAGAGGFLDKPYSIIQLSKSVSAVIHNQEIWSSEE